MNKLSKTPLHYGWIICLTGVAVLFSCLGLGRFSLGMLLPSMGKSLDLTYAQMGILGTINFIGYMLSVLLSGRVNEALGARKTIATGLAVVSLSMIGISACDAFEAILVLYFATGFGSGLANVPLMGLISHWFLRNTRGRAAGLMVSGNGLGIIFSGLFIPLVNSNANGEGWRVGWLAIGLLSLVVAVIAAIFLRNHPRDKGLEPLGRDVPTAKSGDLAEPKKNKKGTRRDVIRLGVIYLLFGATYAVYATFIVTAMVNERHFGEDVAGQFWAVVGGLSIISGPLFGWIADRFSRKISLVIAYALFAVSYSFAAMNLSNAFLYASIVVFGVTVWSIPTIMSAAVGDYMGPEKAVKAFGFITLFLGAGQIAGPAAAGFLADVSGNFNMAFWMCAALALCATGLSLAVRKPD